MLGVLPCKYAFILVFIVFLDVAGKFMELFFEVLVGLVGYDEVFWDVPFGFGYVLVKKELEIAEGDLL